MQKSDKMNKKEKKGDVALPCPCGGDHDWQPAYVLSEAERFQIGVRDNDTVCVRCLGRMQDYDMVE